MLTETDVGARQRNKRTADSKGERAITGNVAGGLGVVAETWCRCGQRRKPTTTTTTKKPTGCRGESGITGDVARGAGVVANDDVGAGQRNTRTTRSIGERGQYRRR